MAADRAILIVEDEESIRTALRRLFSRRGWEVVEALDGAQALSLLLAPDGDRFRVILSDLRMPGMSGAQLYDQLAAKRPALTTRIVFSTGDVFTEEARELASRSGRVVLQKPFDLMQVLSLAESMG